MIICDRLRELREEKHLSQGDVEKADWPARCYLSRVENGHTVPAIETLEKMARALNSMYQLSTMVMSRPNCQIFQAQI